MYTHIIMTPFFLTSPATPPSLGSCCFCLSGLARGPTSTAWASRASFCATVYSTGSSWSGTVGSKKWPCEYRPPHAAGVYLSMNLSIYPSIYPSSSS